MNRIIKYLTGIYFICFFIKANEVKAQDPIFTQFYANPLYLNPAFAGVEVCPRSVLSYRNQWSGIESSFITSSVSYDQFVDVLSGGIGIIILNDVVAEDVLKTTSVQAIYSYQLKVNRKFTMQGAIQGGWMQKKVDWSEFHYGDMIDNRRGIVYDSQEKKTNSVRNVLDLSAGIIGFNRNYFIGFAVHHLLQPNESVLAGFSELPRKYTIHFGAEIPIKSKGWASILSPNILLQRQNEYNQINIGLYFSKGPLVGGLWYRDSDSFISLLGFKKDNFKIGYSYDVTVSSLTNQTYGSHEISLGYIFKCKPKRRKFRTVSCPSF